MSAHIQTQIEAEAIFDAMMEDGGFACEMWEEMADRLQKGVLLDEALDLIKAHFSTGQKKAFVHSLTLMADVLKDHLDYEIGEKP